MQKYTIENDERVNKLSKIGSHGSHESHGSHGSSGDLIKKKDVRPSAFRAVNTSVDQIVTANTPVAPVLYPNEQFDLNKEYNPDKSTFTPKQDGIYLIILLVFHFSQKTQIQIIDWY